MELNLEVPLNEAETLMATWLDQLPYPSACERAVNYLYEHRENQIIARTIGIITALKTHKADKT